MIRPILKWPAGHKMLHTVSAPVTDAVSPEALAELISDMWETMYDAEGVGLAAIQIGVPFRLMVMDVHTVPYVFINPQVTVQGKDEWMPEGCLSIPGTYEDMRRYPQVHVTALDKNLVSFTKTFTKMEAQCVQHEFDHLNGIMMPDRKSAADRPPPFTNPKNVK